MSKSFNPVGKPQNSWLTSDGKFLPFSEMTDEHIKLAHFHAQNKEREYIAKSNLFSKLQVGLEEEAAKRGFEIPSRSKFAKNNMEYRKKKKSIDEESNTKRVHSS